MEFVLLFVIQTCFGTHQTSCPIGARGPFPGLKRQEREAGHSPPSSA
jgi:hypothetical protein